MLKMKFQDFFRTFQEFSKNRLKSSYGWLKYLNPTQKRCGGEEGHEMVTGYWSCYGFLKFKTGPIKKYWELRDASSFEKKNFEKKNRTATFLEYDWNTGDFFLKILGPKFVLFRKFSIDGDFFGTRLEKVTFFQKKSNKKFLRFTRPHCDTRYFILLFFIIFSWFLGKFC